MNNRIYTDCSRGHATFSSKVTPLFDNMYTVGRLELVKKVVAKRSKEGEMKKKHNVERERERKSKHDAKRKIKGKAVLTPDEEERRRKERKATRDRPTGGFREAGMREEERRKERTSFPTHEPVLVTEEEAEEDALTHEALKIKEEEGEVEKDVDEEEVSDNDDDDDQGAGDGNGAGCDVGDNGGDGGDVGDTQIVSEDDSEEPSTEYEKDGTDEKIEYETMDGKKVETNLSQERSKWFKPLQPVPRQLVQKIRIG
ncbi:hypothetical protein L1987_15386 [Smallanthus sonchifolius]|uniref:Uncharacterized protein n=1 Tax=Smallanthus sonchifolius TaxID=185202 RepID=A0ACB9J5S9_9ASTR|nr:hypothetical protein L1987_15386 [Smallanthus sonchifolius]